MKRDLDLLRTILLAIEASADDEPASIHLPVDQYDTLHLSHHVRLLHEAGLIHAIENQRVNSRMAWIPHSLTWRGHDFLNAIRDARIWEKVQRIGSALGGDLPSDIIFELAMRDMRKALDLTSNAA